MLMARRINDLNKLLTRDYYFITRTNSYQIESSWIKPFKNKLISQAWESDSFIYISIMYLIPNMHYKCKNNGSKTWYWNHSGEKIKPV